MTARSWYSISNAAAATQVAIYDAIGSGGVTAEKFLDRLKDITGPIALSLCSVGGDFFQGMAIADALRRRGDVTAHVALAASIASAIAVSCDRVLVGEDGYFMVHAPFVTMTGDAEDLEHMAGTLRKLGKTLGERYRRRTRQSEATVSRWMSDETWFDAKESVSARLADAIDDQPARIAASVDLGRFKNPPASLRAPAAGWDRVIAAKFAAR